MPVTFMNWLINLRKLGQISSPFCILYEYDKEGSNVSGIIPTHLAASFRSMRSDVI